VGIRYPTNCRFFEIGADSTLLPWRLRSGTELYEREIEELLSADFKDFTGESLFAQGRGGQRPCGTPPVLSEQ